MDPKNFFAELKRRNVYKVAVAYVVAGWALAQGLAQVLPVFSIPNWIIQLLVVLIVMGLPIALGSGLGLRADVGRNQAHGRCRRCENTFAWRSLDLRCDRRRGSFGQFVCPLL